MPPYTHNYESKIMIDVLLKEWLWHYITHKGLYAIKAVTKLCIIEKSLFCFLGELIPFFKRVLRINLQKI